MYRQVSHSSPRATVKTNLFDTTSCDRRFHSDRRDSILSSTSFTHPPLKYLYMKRTCTPHPKIFLHIRLLQTWEVRLEDLRALTPYSSYKERTYIHKILVSSIPLYKHQTASSSRYVEFPNSQTFRVVGNHSVTDLTFRGSLVSTPPVLFIGSSPFVLQVPPVIALVDDQLTDDCIHH